MTITSTLSFALIHAGASKDVKGLLVWNISG
jgi:hypothetical protein